MAACGAGVRGPCVAVALSGGADSLALTLLAASWCRRHGKRMTALIVDHGLRADSRAEAERVAGWMRERAIDHAILTWRGDRPRAGVQDAARAARYRLLVDGSRERGATDLLLAHHQADQAETVLMRLLAGSGPLGLAGMAPVTDVDGVWLMRPLLGVAPARLRATLQLAGQSWIEDPSNLDRRYLRARLRPVPPVLKRDGMDVAAEADRFARERRPVDQAVADILERIVSWSDFGAAEVAAGSLVAAGGIIGPLVLQQILAVAGGRAYLVDAERATRLFHALAPGETVTATLAGCRISARRGRLTVVREARNLPAPAVVAGGETMLWDGRFRVRLAVPPDGASRASLTLRPAAAVERALLDPDRAPPAAVWPTVPVLADDRGMIECPLAGYRRAETAKTTFGFADIAFRWHRTHVPYGYFLGEGEQPELHSGEVASRRLWKCF